MRISGILTISTMAVIIATAALVQGLLEFTAKVEQKCNLCHVDPAGTSIYSTLIQAIRFSAMILPMFLIIFLDRSDI